MSSGRDPITPIILDGRESTPIQQSPLGAFSMRRPSLLHAILRGGLGALLLVAAIVNQVSSTRFPSSATAEHVVAIAFTAVLLVGAVFLAVFAVLAALRQSVPLVRERTSPLSVVSLALVGLAFAVWMVFGLFPTLFVVSGGGTASYLTATGPLLVFAAPWMLGTALGAISLRSGGRRTALYGGIAVGLGTVLVLVVMAASVLLAVGAIS